MCWQYLHFHDWSKCGDLTKYVDQSNTDGDTTIRSEDCVNSAHIVDISLVKT